MFVLTREGRRSIGGRRIFKQSNGLNARLETDRSVDALLNQTETDITLFVVIQTIKGFSNCMLPSLHIICKEVSSLELPIHSKG